jgi:hypothetical protein
VRLKTRYFHNVVLRFRKSIQTECLGAVSVEDADYEEIEKGMTKCSNYLHDKAMEGGTAVPEPAELLTDIDMLVKWRGNVDARSKALVKKRQSTDAAATLGDEGVFAERRFAYHWAVTRDRYRLTPR